MTFIGIITLNLLYWQFIISSKRSKFSEQNTDYLTAPLVLLCIRDVITGVINPHVNQKNGAQVWVLGVPRWPPPPAPAAFVYSVSFFFFSVFFIIASPVIVVFLVGGFQEQ